MANYMSVDIFRRQFLTRVIGLKDAFQNIVLPATLGTHLICSVRKQDDKRKKSTNFNGQKHWQNFRGDDERVCSSQ